MLSGCMFEAFRLAIPETPDKISLLLVENIGNMISIGKLFLGYYYFKVICRLTIDSGSCPHVNRFILNMKEHLRFLRLSCFKR